MVANGSILRPVTNLNDNRLSEMSPNVLKSDSTIPYPVNQGKIFFCRSFILWNVETMTILQVGQNFTVTRDV